MKVIINDREYIPKDAAFVEAHGVKYDNIARWLFNIHCVLVNRWVEYMKGCESLDNPMGLKLRERVEEFERFAEEFLGYKEDSYNHRFEEIPNWTLSDYGKMRDSESEEVKSKE